MSGKKTRQTKLRSLEFAAQRRGAIAQLGERYNGIVEVGSSILPGSTTSDVIKAFSPHRLEA